MIKKYLEYDNLLYNSIIFTFLVAKSLRVCDC